MQSGQRNQRDWFPVWVVLWSISMIFAIIVQVVGNSPAAQEAYADFYRRVFLSEIDVSRNAGSSLIFMISAGLSALLMLPIAVRARSWYVLFVSSVLVVGPILGSLEMQAIGLAYPQLQNLTRLALASAPILLLTALLLFPNGRFTPRWTALILYGFIVYRIAGLRFVTSQAYWEAGQLFSVAAIVALIWRYTRTRSPFQRNQFRWLFAAILVSIAAGPLLFSEWSLAFWQSLTGSLGMDMAFVSAVNIARSILTPVLVYFAMCDEVAFLRPTSLWAGVRTIFAPIFRVALATPTFVEANEEPRKIEDAATTR